VNGVEDDVTSDFDMDMDDLDNKLGRPESRLTSVTVDGSVMTGMHSSRINGILIFTMISVLLLFLIN
jgi:hypothetical protein